MQLIILENLSDWGSVHETFFIILGSYANGFNACRMWKCSKSTESENVDTTEKVNTEAESEEQNTEPAEAEGAEGTEKSETKILVAYFSATGTTKQIAEQIAEVTGADLFEIMPVDAYSSEDLDYGNDDCRANREQNDSTSRPEISNAIENIENYDTVFIGYPKLV